MVLRPAWQDSGKNHDRGNDYKVFRSNGVLPAHITQGPDGNLWFTDEGSDFIGRITPAGAITEYPVTKGAAPAGITAGPDGALWFTERGAIGKISTTGVVTEFLVGGNANPYEIAAGGDGNLWFTDIFNAVIGRMTPTGGVTFFSISSGADARGIVAGPDGNIWFAEGGQTPGRAIGKITLGQTVTITEMAVPSGGITSEVTVGPDSEIWFREHKGRTSNGIPAVGKVDPGTGNFVEYVYAPVCFPGGCNAAVSSSGGIVTGPDGSLWNTSESLSQIVRIGSDGSLLNTYSLNFGAMPWFIAAGGDGNLWFTERRPVRSLSFRLATPSGLRQARTARCGSLIFLVG